MQHPARPKTELPASNQLQKAVCGGSLKHKPFGIRGVGGLLSFIAIFCSTALATNHFIRINEIMGGLNGDSRIQFVEIVASDDGQKAWGPGGAAVGRTMLVFFDATGKQTGRFVFPSNPAGGKQTVLIATKEFKDLTGITPDFIMPTGIMPIAGKVSFRNNPDNTSFTVNLSLSYGGTGFTGSTEGAGPVNTNTLPIMGAQSLTRATMFNSFSDAPNGGDSNTNAHFTLGTPTPSGTQNPAAAGLIQSNMVGQAGSQLLVATNQIKQGENLFTKETFLGNGRTCVTCHKATDSFGLPPSRIATLPATDPLFVNEFNVNTLVVSSAGSVNPSATSGASQPSDFFLGGAITNSAGVSAIVLAGTGRTNLIFGGSGFAVGNVVSDTNGNRGTIVSFTLGNLNGPTASNGSTNGLENSTLLRGARGLILENINGFNNTAFMRASPHLLNLKHTAPFGLSGEFADLQTFSAGAVQQHFPRRLNRTAGTDFRAPTSEELDALAAFQNSILLPKDENFDHTNNFNRFATTEAQKRGRSLFFGGAKCSACHSGNVLATSSGAFGTTLGLNQAFNTGVVNLPINTTNGLPTEQAAAKPANSRTFSTPTLFGVKNTGPFFHDNSVSNLLEAIQFYDSLEFRNSPAGTQVGIIGGAVGILANAQDIQAFLESLVEAPVGFTGSLAFGSRLAFSGPSSPLTVTITNIGTASLTIAGVTMAGVNASEFSNATVLPNTGPFTTGQTRTINITYSAVSIGPVTATLELSVSNGTETFPVGVALSGTGVNSAPVLPGQTNRTINELTLLTVTNTASDADLPAQTLTYLLLSGPTNAVISTNGVITWTPSEAQGPSTNTITVSVTDNGVPALSATNSFTVIVNEVNSAPVLPAIGNRINNVGSLLSITLFATDADIPSNTLTYSLLSGPNGMTVNSTSAVLDWTPAAGQSGTTNPVVVIVTDTGVPSLSATQSFSVVVPPLLVPVITGLSPTNNLIVVRTNSAGIFPISFTVSATNAVSYQWSFAGTSIPGETAPTLWINNARRTNNGLYTIAITGPGGTVTTNASLHMIVPQRVQTVQRLADGSIRLLFGDDDAGLPTDLARLEMHSTTNLRAPITWTTNVNSMLFTNGFVQFEDMQASGEARKFYRVIER